MTKMKKKKIQESEMNLENEEMKKYLKYSGLVNKKVNKKVNKNLHFCCTELNRQVSPCLLRSFLLIHCLLSLKSSPQVPYNISKWKRR